MRSEKNLQNFQTYKAILKCLHSIYSQEYQTFRDEKKKLQIRGRKIQSDPSIGPTH